MNDAMRVRISQRIGALCQQGQLPAKREGRRSGDVVRQWQTRKILHCDVESASGLSEVKDGDNVGMLQLPDRASFLHKTHARGFVSCEGSFDNFECDGLTGLIDGLKDLAHSAGA